MSIKFNRIRKVPIITVAALVAGCAGGGYNNANMLGMGSTGNNNTLGAVENAVEGALLGSIAQSMSGSVLNGQIGSQLPQADQNYRLQQLGNMIQTGAVNQSQQWTNPQTGSAISINPIGQNIYNQQIQQQCQPMQEVVILPNGQSITENRLACFNPQTGKWNLAQ